MSDKNRKEYEKELKAYDMLLQAATSVSQSAGNIETEKRYLVATQLFTRMLVMALTFYRLLPGNPITLDRQEHWDWPSVAAIARNFIEAYLHFFYIGVENVSEEEVDFRLKLMQFHLKSEKYRLYKNGSKNADHSDIGKRLFENQLIEKEEIKNHPFFKHLDAQDKKRASDGDSVTYMTKAKLMERLPFQSKELPWMYRHYSNEVHSTAFAFMSLSNERGRGNENDTERAYMKTASHLVRKYLAVSVISIAKIFPQEVGIGASEFVNIAQKQFHELE